MNMTPGDSVQFLPRPAADASKFYVSRGPRPMLARDADSLTAHNRSVAASIDFQLSAALGLINIEQSSIIKIFSVAAVAFLPPTLIASIYGMNFDHMPELSQPWGYPLAVVAMVVSAILPLAWFRKQGWL